MILYSAIFIGVENLSLGYLCYPQSLYPCAYNPINRDHTLAAAIPCPHHERVARASPAYFIAPNAGY
jgi:hypothetical protein